MSDQYDTGNEEAFSQIDVHHPPLSGTISLESVVSCLTYYVFAIMQQMHSELKILGIQIQSYVMCRNLSTNSTNILLIYYAIYINATELLPQEHLCMEENILLL
jgi:hypothetical protein